jgi:RNA-binding motif X-linked protein 2
MNPLTQIKNTQKVTRQEIELGLFEKASWHDRYKHSAYVFAGGLDYGLTEGDLLAVFAQYGELVDVHLARDKATGKSKGFAFLAYEDQRSTVLAVDNLNGATVVGRKIRVEHVDNYRKRKAEVRRAVREGGGQKGSSSRRTVCSAVRQPLPAGRARSLQALNNLIPTPAAAAARSVACAVCCFAARGRRPRRARGQAASDRRCAGRARPSSRRQQQAATGTSQAAAGCSSRRRWRRCARQRPDDRRLERAWLPVLVADRRRRRRRRASNSSSSSRQEQEGAQGAQAQKGEAQQERQKGAAGLVTGLVPARWG